MNTRISLLCLVLAALSWTNLSAQSQSPTGEASLSKRPLAITDVMDFQRITHRALSPDGSHALIVHEPWRGDGDRNAKVKPYPGDATALLYDAQGRELHSFFPTNGFRFSASSRYLVISTRETEAARNARELREQNSKGKNKDKDKEDKYVALDTLYIYDLARHTLERIDSVRSYKVAHDADWLAYQRLAKDSTLYLRSLSDAAVDATFSHVTDYGFSPEGQSLYYNEHHKGKPASNQLFALVLPANTTAKAAKASRRQSPATAAAHIPSPILVNELSHGRKHSSVTFSRDGSRLAFLAGSHLYYADLSSIPDLSGYAASSAQKTDDTQKAVDATPPCATLLVDSTHASLLPSYVLSEHGALQFSRDGSLLYFGVAPAPRERDTTMLLSDRPEPQVWSWNEPVQYTVQSFNRKRDSERSYAAVCHLQLEGRPVVQLADSLYPNITYGEERNARYALLSNTRPYSISSMWEGRTRADYAVVDLLTGERRPVNTATFTRYRLSPTGRYAAGYNETDSSYYSIDLASAQCCRLTTPQTFAAWDEEDDHPDYPGAYGAAGWLEGDEALVVYDRYDLWQLAADGSSAPLRLTTDGREHQRRYRLVRLDQEHPHDAIDPNQPQMLRAFDEVTKGSGYYTLASLRRPAQPAVQHAGLFALDEEPVKAKFAPALLWSESTFEHFPDVRLTQLNARSLAFGRTCQLTHLEEQQRPFWWGTGELVHWTSYSGIPLEGLLFKPEGFDPSRQYPLIVYYYERNSETLYDYRTPAPGRSIIDFHTYVSDGYLVFVPDIRYRDGHPGESAYDCILSGLDSIESLGFVDHARIGTCGHSWGGYQSAYLATRTDRFAAIESGAPVVNMLSAYGGIRWGSGLARSFQYEHTQSRLGTTMWAPSPAPGEPSGLDIYLENSSLLHMDRVQTPILIMHNDTDGHVPWYQGIEMFVALKRLQKPCWLVNYTGEPHWPVRMANRRDWQIRLKQFFDHFLKDAPAPRWMTDGVPAVDAPYDLGY